ncbi:hypothetical protein ABW19_dt0206499 [Dactylella cylindrospora]|nr:hypothetical protein ABW19_dt0206499 [Dactylella cylindrospora]
MPVTTRRKSKLQTSPAPATSRQAIIIDSLGARLESITSDHTPSEGQLIRDLISPAEATRILNHYTMEALPNKVFSSSITGVRKVHVAALPAHEEVEDEFAYEFLGDPTEGDVDVMNNMSWGWSFFAVYDGHYGFATSRYLKDVLITAVYLDLAGLYNSRDDVPPEEIVKETISNTFIRLDNELISRLESEDEELFDIAMQGSCALLSFYDAKNNRLFTACTGDSRAVLGKRVGSANTRWLAKPLSVDQSFASNPEEVRRVEKEHPGENIIMQSRLMGDLAVSRAFGNARFKSAEVADDIGQQLQRIRSNTVYEMSSPPYVTAEPVVSCYSAIKNGDFVILASDGLWDFLSSEDAVALIGRWTDKYLVDSSSHQRKTKLTQSQEEMFVFEDDHAGVHLIRNALGGVREGRLQFTLSLPPGKDAAKRHRDDITVIVVFFDHAV